MLNTDPRQVTGNQRIDKAGDCGSTRIMFLANGWPILVGGDDGLDMFKHGVLSHGDAVAFGNGIPFLGRAFYHICQAQSR